MIGKKSRIKEGDHIFSSKKTSNNFHDIIFGVVTGVEGINVIINGLVVNPIGLKNKISQNKAGPRSIEILTDPTPENCILAFIYRIEYEAFIDTLNINYDKITLITPETYSVLDGWIRESISELINAVLSLPIGTEREKSKMILKKKMETLYDKNLKNNLYSVCRSLKIL